MPAVGMRRSTRVFVPKTKDGEGVRVLRSGRRLWVDSREAKIKGSGGDGTVDLFLLIDNSDEVVAVHRKNNGWLSKAGKSRELDRMDLDEDDDGAKDDSRVENRLFASGSMEGVCADKRYGVVYSRKRKRFDLRSSSLLSSRDISDDCDGADGGDKKFRLHFFRRQRRRIAKTSAPVKEGADWQSDLVDFGEDGLLSVSIDSSYASSCSFLGLLSSVLRRMSKFKLSLRQLSAFLLSEPVANVFASSGIHFFWNLPCKKRSGFCNIYGAKEFIPIFCMDFSSVPLCFIHFHASMWFRSVRLSCLLFINADDKDDDDSDLDELLECISSQRHSCGSSLVAHGSDVFGDLRVVSATSVISKSSSRLLPHRNGVTTRSGQKRRTRSLRSRRARNPSLLGVHRGNGGSIPNFGIRKTAKQYPSLQKCYEISNSVSKNSSTSDIKLLKSTLLALGNDIDSISCFANLLVVESDKCYRESGAHVKLEMTTSNEWILAVRKDGSLRHYHRAVKGKEIKPSCTNRYTYAIIWGVETGWKLEFTARKDWVIFKELFKVCGDRNIVPPPPAAKAIPIPGVFEASECSPPIVAPFARPDSYIKMNDDELSRALLKRTANYDLDSEDEEWLNAFNSKLDAENESGNHVDADTFELMIDAFEKAFFCRPDDLNDAKAATNLCLDLASREIIEVVYSYWMKRTEQRREQKLGALVRVFQSYKVKSSSLAAKSSSLTAKPVLRKKRSTKQRQGTHSPKATTPRGRGKELSVLQAMTSNQNSDEEKRTMLEVQEARAAAKSVLELAIAKRRRAQTLMANADLAMYRAAMALRIARAGQEAEPHLAVAHLLD